MYRFETNFEHFEEVTFVFFNLQKRKIKEKP